MITRNG